MTTEKEIRQEASNQTHHLRWMMTFVALLGVQLLVNGCATMVHGVQKPVFFSTDPPGADVFVDGLFIGRSPLTAPIKHRKDKIVEARLPGYQPAMGRLTTSFSGYSLFLGLGSIVVDGITGAIMPVDQSSLHLALRPLPSMLPPPSMMPASPLIASPPSEPEVPREELEKVGSDYRLLGKALFWIGMLAAATAAGMYHTWEAPETSRKRFAIIGAGMAVATGGGALGVYANSLRWDAFTQTGYGSNRTMSRAWAMTILGGGVTVAGMGMIVSGMPQNKTGLVVGGGTLTTLGWMIVWGTSLLSDQIKYVKPGTTGYGLSLHPWVAPVFAQTGVSGTSRSRLMFGMGGSF